MLVVHKIEELRKIIKEQKKLSKTIGCVPTMGALHQGHLKLIEKSKKETDFTVVTIFVNPIQFGVNEDFSKYPRTLPNDTRLCESVGADLIFAPEVNDMIGNDLLTFVDIKELQDNLCGAKRPGHFRGVCTIVAKFFNIVTPDMAFFGKKDIQQLFIIKKMTKDLNFDIEIIPCEIVREKDGLAMSSRNVYLSAEERLDSTILNKSIKIGVDLIEKGESNPQNIISKLTEIISSVKTSKLDYIKIVNSEMKDVSIIEKGNILALAVYIGKTRLIDNHIIGEKICF